MPAWRHVRADPEVDDRLVTCRCGEAQELTGDAAREYADRHLEFVKVQADGWEVLYRCPATGRRWLKDYPRSAEQGGGPARLRPLMSEQE